MSDEPAKILIVDDDEDITVTISDYFNSQDLGVIPISTSNPRQVMPLMEEHKDIRLILSDFRMPGINGFELLMMVKSKYPKVLFVMMTGYSTQELKREGFKRGAIRYIEKPFDLGELAEIIRDALQGASAGYGGLIESIQLPDIIQLIGMSRRTVTLNINADQGKASIFFSDGEIVHAVTGEQIGDEAFYEIFLWTGGRFTFSPISGEIEKTIEQSWQGLLIEAARREDEAKAEENGNVSSVEDEEESFDLLESLEPVVGDADITAVKAAAEVGNPSHVEEASPEAAVPEQAADSEPKSITGANGDAVVEETIETERPHENLQEEVIPDPTAKAAEEQAQLDQIVADAAAEISVASESIVDLSAETTESEPTTVKMPDTVEEPADISSVEVPPDRDLGRVAEQDITIPNESATVQPDPPKQPVEATQGEEASIVDPEKIASGLQQQLIALWPSEVDQIAYGKAGLDRLPPYLLKHFHFHFRDVLQKFFNVENAPFDFEHQDLSSELERLSNVLLANWQITKVFYEDTLTEAITYEVEQSIDPVKALVGYINRYTSGVASDVKNFIGTLVEYELVDEIFAPLSDDLAGHGDKRIHPRQIEYLGRAILYRRDEEEGFDRMRKAVVRLIELSTDEIETQGRSLSIDVIIRMLEAHGVVQLADYIRSEIKPGHTSLNLSELDEIMDNYRRHSSLSGKK